ncbi:GNAT family protein [Shewanella algae]|uniref:GNAT family N-acetyltransferase n=1 Tax=Shewanella algae TaxID=38313 RepID=UPI0031F5577A
MEPITSTNLTLRRLRASDLAAFSRYRQEPQVARYQSWDTFSFEQAKTLYEAIPKAWALSGHWYQLAIELTDGTLAGDLALHFIDEQQVELGFSLDPLWQRRGIAREAVFAVLDYLFRELGRHRVIAITDTENRPAWRLLEALGFRREGHFIDNIFFKGRWGCEYQYALLAKEWLSK